ncbi:MAG: hypothetical protein AAF417_15065 [Pseudomonadota bacterium]
MDKSPLPSELLFAAIYIAAPDREDIGQTTLVVETMHTMYAVIHGLPVTTWDVMSLLEEVDALLSEANHPFLLNSVSGDNVMTEELWTVFAATLMHLGLHDNMVQYLLYGFGLPFANTSAIPSARAALEAEYRKTEETPQLVDKTGEPLH